MNRWVLLALGVLLSAAFLFQGGLYSIIPISGTIIRMNKFTGSITACSGSRCWEVFHQAQ